MAKAFGIVNFAGNHIAVEGMQEYRPVGAFSFLGRYRVIDFTISNMSIFYAISYKYGNAFFMLLTLVESTTVAFLRFLFLF